jgi:EpsI family protein
MRAEWLLCVLLAAAPMVSEYLRPERLLARELPALDLEREVPEQFGEWSIDRSIVPISPSPDVQVKLDQTYSQVLGRTYVNRAGYRVMLSIAYGVDQSSDSTSVHRPEFCYAAQGFRLAPSKDGSIQLTGTQIPVRRLVAERAVRREPITYWVMLGTNASLPGVQRKVDQLRLGLSGVVPDGMLVRVSSIDSSDADAYRMQAEFIEQLARALPVSVTPRVFGAT